MKSATFGLLTAVLVLVSSVSAHGYVDSLTVDGKTFPGFLPDYDLWDKPDPMKITRHIPDDGPVLDFTSEDLTCNVGAEDAAWRTTSHAPINAGSEVTMHWVRWPTDHHGPITVYMANCNGPCTDFDATGNVWFKIDEMGLVSGETDTGTWASDVLIANNLSWTVTVPSALKAGAYLIRMEILALHSAGAPQFYPSCSQLVVSGSGTSSPATSELAAIPGIYTGDTSTSIDIWTNGITTYPIAGPAVTKLAAFSSDPANSKTGGIGPIPFVAGTVVLGDGTPISGGSLAATTTASDAATTTVTGIATSVAAATTKVKACRVKASSKKRSLENKLRGETNASRQMTKRHVEVRKRRLSV